MKVVYTVGHSVYAIDEFISLLQEYKIDSIVDVRSTPYSQFASQYNKEGLKAYLKIHHILYIYMGDMLGARYEDKSLLFENGQVNFKKVQKTNSFQKGIARVLKGVNKGYKIALMCSEKEAFDCHRFGLVSEALIKNAINVKHIYRDKVLSQKQLEAQLLQKYNKKLPKADLFNPNITEALQMEIAYRLRNRDIASTSLH